MRINEVITKGEIILVISTNSVGKNMEIRLENLYVDIGA